MQALVWARAYAARMVPLPQRAPALPWPSLTPSLPARGWCTKPTAQAQELWDVVQPEPNTALAELDEGVAVLPLPEERRVDLDLTRRKLSEAMRNEAGKAPDELLRAKFDFEAPSEQERGEIASTAARIVDMLSMPYAPSGLIRGRRVALLPDEHEPSVFFSRNPRTFRPYTRYIRGVAEAGLRGNVEEALAEMQAQGLEPDAHIYSSALVVYLRGDTKRSSPWGARVAAASALVAHMEGAGVAMSAHVLTTYVAVLCDDVPASTQGSTELDHAFAVVERHKDVASIHTYTALVKGCLRVRDYKRAWAVFDHLRVWQGLKPDIVLYSLMISVCAITGEAERAFRLYRELEGQRLYPTEVTFNALLACFRLRPDLYDDMFTVLADMRKAGYAPDSTTYRHLLDALATAGDHRTAELVWDELVRHDPAQATALAPTTYLVETYARAAHRKAGVARTKEAEVLLAKGEAAYERLLAHGVVPDVHLLNAALHLYTEGLRLQRAMKFRDEEFKRHNVAPNLDTYKALIKMFGRARRMERALEQLALLKARGFRPDVQTYAHVLVGCTKAKYTTSGMRLIREMKARGLPLEHHFHCIRNFRANLSKSPHLIREIDALTHKPQPSPRRRLAFRKQKALMRPLSKAERRVIAREPVWPTPKVASLGSR